MATRQRRSSASPPELPTDTLTDEERAVWQMPIPNGAQHLPMLQDDTEEPAEETAVDRVASMLGAFTDDDRAVVKLYRVLGPNKLGWCQDYSVAEFDQGGFELIRSQWGPGEYSVRVMGSSTAKGGVSLRKVANVVIQGSAASGAPTAQQSGTGADASLARSIEAMMHANQQFQQNLLQALTQRPDPMSQMRETMGLMTMMREAMGLSSAAAPSQKSSIREIVEAIQELKGVSELVNPEPADPDNLMAMVPQFLDLVKASQAQRAQLAPAEGLAPPLLSNPTPSTATSEAGAAPQPPAPHTPTEGEDPMLALLQRTLAPLFTMAVAQMPPQVGADYIDSVCESDALTDEQHEQFHEVLQHPQWFEGLCMVIPEAKPHEAWMRQARDTYLAMLQEGGDEAPEAPAAPAAQPAPQGGAA